MKTWEEKLEPCGPCQRCLMEGMAAADDEMGGEFIPASIREAQDRQLEEAGPCTCPVPPEVADQNDVSKWSDDTLAELIMFGWGP